VADFDGQAGSAYIPITPDFSGFQKSIKAQMPSLGAQAGQLFTRAFRKALGDPFDTLQPPDQARAGAKAGGQFAESFRKAIEGALKALPDAKIDADSTPAQRRIQEIRAELEELSTKRIGVDLSDDEALAKLTAFRAELGRIGAESPSVRIKVDTAAASAELLAFSAEVKAAGTAGNNAGDDVSDGLLSGVESSGVLVSVLAGLSPLLTTAAAAAAGLAGALAAAAAAGGIGLGGMALVAIPAISKVTAALSAQKTAQQAATTATTAGASSAQQQKLALGQVAAAERNLTQAQQQAKTAQKDLSAARVQARQDAVDLANSVKDAALTEQADVLGIQAARLALQQQAEQTAQAQQALTQARGSLTSAQGSQVTVDSDPGSTAAQKSAAAAAVAAAQQQVTAAQLAAREQQLAQKQAALAVKQAIQQLDEQRIAYQRLQQQQAASDAAGIAGDKNVIAARRELTSADDQVRSAELALAQARYAAAAAGRTQASEGVSDAAKAASAMAALSAPERALLRTWQSLTTAYDKWATPLQKPVLGVLNKGLQLAERLLPQLTPFVTGSAKALDGLETSASRALGGPWWKSFDATMAKLTPKALTGFGTALLNIGTGFAGLMQAFAPFSAKVLTGLDKLTGKFATWGKQLASSSGFQQFMAYVTRNGPLLISLLGSLFTIAVKLGVGLAPLGQLMLRLLVPLAAMMASLSPNRLLVVATGISALAAVFTGSILAIIATVVGLAATVVNNWGTIRRTFDTGIAWIETHWTEFWAWIKSLNERSKNVLLTGVQSLWSGIHTAFTGGIADVKRIWSGLENVTKIPVNWVIKNVYDNGIAALWNKAADIVHLPKLPPVPLLAQGAVIRRPTMAVVGEAGPEMVLPLSRPARMAQLLGSVGIPMLADGGIFGAVGGFLSSAVRKVGGWVDGNLGHAFGALGARLTDRITSRIAGGARAGSWGQIVAALPGTLVTGLAKFLTGQDAKAIPVPSPGAAGSGVARWAKYILQALSMLGQPASDLAAVEHRMAQESGGNPTIVNKWDSNWAAGTPSVGLMQVIGPTFADNAGPFRDTGPFEYGTSVNPLANIYAGLHHALTAYPGRSLASVMMQPGGYDDGGWMAPGYGTYLNATRKPEAVLTDAQWAMVSRAVVGGDGAQYHDHYHIGELVGATVESKVRAALSASQIAQRRRLRPGRRK
jgi:SLT domain-containing protein